MCKCYLCGARLVGEARTKEHVILNALGGRHYSYDLICQACNSGTGHLIDAELANQLRAVTNLLGVQRNRGKTQNVIVRRDSGEELIREPSGRMHPRRTSASSRLEGRTLQFEASGAPREVRRHLRKLKKKYPTIDIADALEKMKDQVSYTSERLTFYLDQLGGPTALRAVAKIAANFAVWREHVGTPSSALFISGKTQENDVAWWWSGADPIVERPSDAVLNVVSLVGGEGRIRAYVELLHAFRFGVLVDESYTGPYFTEVLARDVMTGLKIDLEWDPTKWKIDDLPELEDFRERMVLLGRVAEAASLERTVGEIANRGSRTLQEYRPNATSEDAAQMMWKEMEPLVLALLRTSRVTDSEAPDDEPEWISSAASGRDPTEAATAVDFDPTQLGVSSRPADSRHFRSPLEAVGHK
jgi:hypothetical protein